MEFVRTDALLQQARRQGIVGRGEFAQATEWLKAYDQALDGRLDGGFFDFQISGDLCMTIDHPFSTQTQKTQGLQRLLNQLFLEGPPQIAVRPQVLPRAAQPRELSAWEIGLMVLLALNPLSYAGCDSSNPLNCSACPNDLCYEGEKTVFPDAGDADAALSTDAEAPVTVRGIICGCPPETHQATCAPDEPGGRPYQCCISDDPSKDNY